MDKLGIGDDMVGLVESELNAAGMHFAVEGKPTRTWFSFEGLLRSGKAPVTTEVWVGGGDAEQS